VAREASTRHFVKPVIVVDEPKGISQQIPHIADDLLAEAPRARIAVCDAWDDVDTQPDAFARLFDTSDTDEVPTLTMRRPRPWTELNPSEVSLEPAEVGGVIDDHAGPDVLTSARRIAKLVS
jgi:hypothetical protein